jgi:restriction endonuclease S subunit
MPIDGAGNFDLTTQERIVERYRPFLEIQKKLEKIGNRIENTIVNLESQYPHVEVQLSTILKPRQGNAYYTRKRIIGNGWAGEVPVYSSNTENNGLLMRMDLAHVNPNDLYYQSCLTWTVDGFLAGKIFHRNLSNDKNIKSKEFYFTINNHCGILLPTAEGLYLPFIRQILQPMFHEKVKGYGQNKLGTNQIKDIVLKIPVNSIGDFDLEVQKEIAKKYETIDSLRASAIKQLNSLVKCSVVPN